jgi:uncharacterized protein (DUF2164 family)
MLAEVPESARRGLPTLNVTGAVYSENPAQRLLLVNGLVLPQGATAAPEVVIEEIRPAAPPSTSAAPASASASEEHRLMAIELSKQARADAIASIERWFREERDEKIGNIAAGALLGFFLEELGPVVFNQAVAQVQERLQMRIMELDIEIHEDEFQYWRRRERAARGR